MNIINSLIKLANDLESNDRHTYAYQIDTIINKIAGDVIYLNEKKKEKENPKERKQLKEFEKALDKVLEKKKSKEVNDGPNTK